MRNFLIMLGTTLFLTTACQAQHMEPTKDTTPHTATQHVQQQGSPAVYPVTKSDAEWRALLSPMEFHILREKGTERAFTGKYYGFDEAGSYHCAGCGAELFSSDSKFDCGSGWPSFWTPANEAAVHSERDERYGMVRDEVLCARCGGHLGHVFDDGPRPTGLRYCINSVALEFKPKQ